MPPAPTLLRGLQETQQGSSTSSSPSASRSAPALGKRGRPLPAPYELQRFDLSLNQLLSVPGLAEHHAGNQTFWSRVKELSWLVASLAPARSSSSTIALSPAQLGGGGPPASPSRAAGDGKPARSSTSITSQPVSRAGMASVTPVSSSHRALKPSGSHLPPGGNSANVGTHAAPALPFSRHKDSEPRVTLHPSCPTHGWG